MEYNESVVNYLKNNMFIMEEYFEECEKDKKIPNYSEFCRKYLSGNTSEGVSFDSIKLKRKELTVFLRNQYNSWLVI